MSFPPNCAAMNNQATTDKVDFEWIISRRVVDDHLTVNFSFGESKWGVKLFPYGTVRMSEKGSATIAISLDKSLSNILASPKVRIVNQLFPEKTVVQQVNSFVFLNKPVFSEICEFSNIIHLSEILKESSGFLVDDYLKIAIQLNVQARSADLLSTNFISNQKKLFDSGEYSDCVLVCPDGEVKAMKFLLASQSDVFRTMFQSDTKEAHTGRVEIQDISASVISEIVKFTLSGRVENPAELVEELFAAADKYNFDDLKNQCILQLCDTITIENLSKRCIIADRYRVHCLTKEINNFLWRYRYHLPGSEKLSAADRNDLLNEIANTC